MIYTLFRVYTIVLTISSQNVSETSFSNNGALAASAIDLFLLLSIPFFPYVLGEDSCLLIQFSSQNILNSLEVNYPALSNIKYFILTQNSFSTPFLNILNLSKDLNFSLTNATHIILVKSSTKIIKYLSQ